jgi:hypothetical protein
MIELLRWSANLWNKSEKYKENEVYLPNAPIINGYLFIVNSPAIISTCFNTVSMVFGDAGHITGDWLFNSSCYL